MLGYDQIQDTVKLIQTGNCIVGLSHLANGSNRKYLSQIIAWLSFE
jgi:hypothetical protein